MSILFSQVEITADDGWMSTAFLMGGIPRELDDLEGVAEYEEFIEAVEDNECELRVHVESFLCGEGETVNADEEEIAFLNERIMEDGQFLYNQTDNIETVDFSGQYDPYEENTYGMELR